MIKAHKGKIQTRMLGLRNISINVIILGLVLKSENKDTLNDGKRNAESNILV